MKNLKHRYRIRHIAIALSVYASLYVNSGWAKDVADACRIDTPHQARGRTLDDEMAKGIAAQGQGNPGACTINGDRRSIGDGYIQTYTQLKPDGTPLAIGFRFPHATFNNLPTIQYDGLNCYDVNGNGKLDFDADIAGGLNEPECGGGHSLVLDFPAKNKIAPFKWGLVNWQAHGHTPGDVYDAPHFDFHFFTQDVIARNFIRVGPCALLINCDDMVTAQKPIPAGYVHPDYVDVGAAESRSGNHLVDLSAPEWRGVPFTETWLYGAYDGKITFWEPMITVAYFETKPDRCKDLKLPTFYQENGYYPTRYCIRYRPTSDEYTVSLEGLTYRQAQ